MDTSYQFDLVDEMQWEDVAEEQGLFITLEEAGLEESDEGHAHGIFHSNEGSVYSYTEWYYDESYGNSDAFSII